jgi:hypothetical protein
VEWLKVLALSSNPSIEKENLDPPDLYLLNN